MSTSPIGIERHVHIEHVMGTVVSIDVRSRVSPEAALGRAVASLHQADETFSTYRDDSAIRRLDRHELLLEDAPADVREVLASCEALRQETDGAFDARCRGSLDPSAYVKGWAAQRAAELLVAEGFVDVCVTAGGDVAARGNAAPGVPWRVGIQHPRDRTAIAALVHATDLSVATSGTYERGEHVVDPRTGRAPTGVLSVTVTGPDLGRADAYSTAAFALGPDGAGWTMRLPRGYEAMTVTADDRVLSTPGFPFADAER
ncbi:MAG TPA: FAD:protein FMN transferase [Baekduia sp.]|nr:FAD:protein FMN transferase [Baekduia sp.]